MKLTKQKLEQLILEEFKSMSRKIFDKRRSYNTDESSPNYGGYLRTVGDEERKNPYPEYTEKLADLYANPETRELALTYGDSLDHKPEIKFDPENMYDGHFINDEDRISTFREWHLSKGHGPQIRRTLKKPEKAKEIFKDFVEETKKYLVHNAVIAAYKVNYIPFLDEETGEPLPLGSPRPFHGTNTYHYTQTIKK